MVLSKAISALIQTKNSLALLMQNLEKLIDLLKSCSPILDNELLKCHAIKIAI